jgi:outer membrane lipopolysaccharide assembly protein LptE/RlpB
MFRTKAVSVYALAALLIAALAGCAYTTRNALPAHIHSIAVPVFKNKTYITDYTRKVEVDVTEAVRNAFIQNGELAVVGRESADLILEGEISHVEREVLRSDRYGEAAEIKLMVKARISVYDVKEAKYLIQNQLISNNEKKAESGVYNLRRGEFENAGKHDAIAELGRAIAHAITERWPQSSTPVTTAAK